VLNELIIIKNYNRLFCCVSVIDFKPNILIKNCSIESRFFSYEERYTYYESKKVKQVESRKYKMICLKHHNQVNLLILFNKQWSKIRNYVYVIMFKQLFN